MNIITFSNKLYMSYDFYTKHDMCALDLKLNALVNKNKQLMKKLDRL